MNIIQAEPGHWVPDGAQDQEIEEWTWKPVIAWLVKPAAQWPGHVFVHPLVSTRERIDTNIRPSRVAVYSSQPNRPPSVDDVEIAIEAEARDLGLYLYDEEESLLNRAGGDCVVSNLAYLRLMSWESEKEA